VSTAADLSLAYANGGTTGSATMLGAAGIPVTLGQTYY
jgi:hypothetical protein